MFISSYPPKLMKKMNIDDLAYVLGIINDGKIIKPPICRIDGEYLFIDDYTGYSQCDVCGKFYRLYMGESIDNLDSWEEFNIKCLK